MNLQVNAGTVEFMVEPNGNYYFLEVNPRIQARAPHQPADILRLQSLVPLLKYVRSATQRRPCVGICFYDSDATAKPATSHHHLNPAPDIT